MNKGAREFRDKYEVKQSAEPQQQKTTFDPNTAAKAIELEQLHEFVKLVRETPNENLIAYKDSKVQELVDYIMAAIILENERINEPDAFPLQIYRRYKSDESLQTKMDDYAAREDKQGKPVTDYLGFKIIPEAEHTIFSSGGDKELQRLIEKKERIRSFVSDMYHSLSITPKMTFEEYSKKCTDILRQLYKCFPQEASTRRLHYKKKIQEIRDNLEEFKQTVEDPNQLMSLDEISSITDVNIRMLLRELTQNYPNEVILYKIHSDLMKTFENSELLRDLRYFCIF